MDDNAMAEMRLLIDRMVDDAVRRHIEAAIQKIEAGKTVESVRSLQSSSL
jgi:divalent metal cation (Fe/Co/Zn/Cd) transporter